MKKNKKGFTLIELIICLAIVAALGTVAILGLQKVLKGTKVDTYKNDIKEVLSSTRIYLQMQKIESTNEESSIMLNAVVTSGNIDESIYDKINGFTCTNFDSGVLIYHKESGGLKTIYMKDANNNDCSLENIDSCNFKDACK